MGSVTFGFLGYINIIVPNETAKNRTIEKIEKWKAKIQDGTFTIKNAVYIKLTTYNELKQNKNEKAIKWTEERAVYPPKRKEGV